MSPKPDVSQERKQQITQAAQKVFSRLGFHQARMSDIAEESGLSKGTLYLYFDSKDEIIINLLDNLFEPEFQDLKSLVDLDLPAPERIRKYTERVIADMERMLKWMPIAFEFVSLAFRRETVQEVLQSYYKEHLHIITPLFEQGLERGEFSPHDPEAAAIALGAIIEGTALLWVYDRQNLDVGDRIRSSVNLVLQGLEP